MPSNTEEIGHAYKSKYDLKRENQVILLMITDGKNGIILLKKNIKEQHQIIRIFIV